MIDLPVVFERSPWGLVVVHGPDATSFLQAIVSQDLDPVGVGETVAALLLQPQGKLEVAFRATRRRRVFAGAGGAGGGAASDGAAGGGAAGGGAAGDEWWLDTEPAFAARLAEGLGRYRIRVKVEIDDRTSDTAMASVVGTGDVSVTAGTDIDEHGDGQPGALGPQRIATTWADQPGADVIGARDVVGHWTRESGCRRGTPAELEVLRIEAGVPKLGVDVDGSTIPQEAFLERDAVSFTKGCFIGQELVCRIDSRGHVNRFLRRLALPGAAPPPPGSEVLVDDKVVGHVTSAAAVPGEDRTVALAMVRREVEPPAHAAVHWAGRTVPASVLP